MGELDFFEKVLAEKGFDPKTYRSTFLMRHAESRMKSLGLPTLNRYSLLLRRDDAEFRTLLDSLSINVTSFFRDPETFESFENIVLPRLLNRKQAAALRIWSAGCATGQESYSIAMRISSVLKRRKQTAGVHIYATDINDKALQKAKKGEYSGKELEGVKHGLLEEFFDLEGNRYVIKRFLRKWMHFLNHDLLKGRIFPQIDAIFCRNVLIYLEKKAQIKALGRFSESLVPGGFLILGGSEALPPDAARFFEPVSIKGRLYQKH